MEKIINTRIFTIRVPTVLYITSNLIQTLLVLWVLFSNTTLMLLFFNSSPTRWHRTRSCYQILRTPTLLSIWLPLVYTTFRITVTCVVSISRMIKRWGGKSFKKQEWYDKGIRKLNSQYKKCLDQTGGYIQK